MDWNDTDLFGLNRTPPEPELYIMVASWNVESELWANITFPNSAPHGSRLGLNTSAVSLPKSQDIHLLKGSLTTVFLPLIYFIIFIVGLPTNTMALWVFLFRTKKKHPASILMANLALADLLFIVWLPLKITYHFKGNDWTFGSHCVKS
ncbi:hypothetical protein MHYP_G00219610 [Metynnis hypsauchen]